MVDLVNGSPHRKVMEVVRLKDFLETKIITEVVGVRIKVVGVVGVRIEVVGVRIEVVGVRIEVVGVSPKVDGVDKSIRLWRMQEYQRVLLLLPQELNQWVLLLLPLELSLEHLL
jgi:hypothetical protein